MEAVAQGAAGGIVAGEQEHADLARGDGSEFRIKSAGRIFRPLHHVILQGKVDDRIAILGLISAVSLVCCPAIV